MQGNEKCENINCDYHCEDYPENCIENHATTKPCDKLIGYEKMSREELVPILITFEHTILVQKQANDDLELLIREVGMENQMLIDGNNYQKGEITGLLKEIQRLHDKINQQNELEI